MHESFHHEMAKTMNDLIFLSAIVSEMFFQFSTLLCTLTLGIYCSNDDKCLAEKRLFSILLPPFFSFKITIPHNENKFLCEFIAFVCDDFKEKFSTLNIAGFEGRKKRKKSQRRRAQHIVIQPTLTAAKALKWKRTSTVSVTMNRRRRDSDFCLKIGVAFANDKIFAPIFR